MKIVVPSFDQRRKQIDSKKALDCELSKAEQYVSKLRKRAKKTQSLPEKIEIGKRIKEAERVLKRLKTDYFEIEAAISNKHKCGAA